MIKRCEVTIEEPAGWGNVEVRCPNDAAWKAKGHFFCERCFLEAVRDGSLRRAGVVALFFDEVLDEAAE